MKIHFPLFVLFDELRVYNTTDIDPVKPGSEAEP
jgi:hypothetical protein